MSAKRMFAALALLLSLPSVPVHAAGSLANVSVIDRNTGQTLPVHQHAGRYWVTGNPGSRYAVRVHNRSGERLLSVVAVDGVNVISGETAGTSQSGYVFAPWERYDIAGWRKSQAEVAAFFFTSLGNSYAARTGRPGDVGVIGVALFRESPPALSNSMPRQRPYGRLDEGAGASSRDRAEAPAAAPPAEAEAKRAAPADSAGTSGARAQPREKLGTGHGARESAWVDYTAFQRARETPDEVIVIHYDSRENLVAMGVLPELRPLPRPAPRPRPFPGQPEIGYVPDPPRTW
jgi:hypothetical protein